MKLLIGLYCILLYHFLPLFLCEGTYRVLSNVTCVMDQNVCLILPIMLQGPDAAEISRQSKALTVDFITQTFVILASLLQGDGVEFLSEVSSFTVNSPLHQCGKFSFSSFLLWTAYFFPFLVSLWVATCNKHS